jgi:DNA-binding transcriptional LysR family regulator
MANDESGEPQRAAVRPFTGRHFARNLDWNLLRAFHEIVQAGGISRAAQRTGQKQPALSMALKRLEDHIGARLCRRGPGGFKLTREGELLAETCASIFGSVAHIPHSVANVATDVHGRVRIQLISNLVDARIDDAIQSFHHAHELVEIFVSVATWDVIQRSVLRNEVEIGIAPAPAHHRDPDLHYEVLFHEVYRPYCGRSHPLFGVTVDQPADLAGYSFVLTGADEPDQQTKFRQRYGLGRHVAGLSEHLEEARRLTVLGLGLCFLPEAFASRDTATGQLHPVLASGNNPSSEILVISNPQAPTHRARDLLLQYFRKSMPAA